MVRVRGRVRVRVGVRVRVAPVTGSLPRGGEVGVVDEGLAWSG